MEILMLTWEYPPRIIGNIALYCEKLAKKLSKDHQVTVATFDDWRAHLGIETRGNVKIVYTTAITPSTNTLTWALTFNVKLEQIIADMYFKGMRFDVMHAQEWIVIPAAIAIKKYFSIPLVISYHTFEFQRSFGIFDSYMESIDMIERQGLQYADAVIVKDIETRNQVINYTPRHKVIHVINDKDPDWVEKIINIYHRIRKLKCE
jgi:glycosyltransferase involved in cell wall biosynthesis